MNEPIKSLLEVRNSIKETIKGTALEEFIRFIYETFRPLKNDFAINRRDDNLTIQIMHKVLNKESNCIDIGCNTGDFLKTITQLSPLGHHYAFEPIPRLAKRLKKRFPNTDVRQIALSDSDGEKTFWYVVDSPALSSLQKGHWHNHKPNAEIEPITVKTQRLDNILKPELNIHFMKVDVEGAEVQVFMGAIKTIKTYKPYIIFERGKNDFQQNHESRIYHLLVNECGMQIFELKSWLEGSSPLSHDQYVNSAAWNFLATP